MPWSCIWHQLYKRMLTKPPGLEKHIYTHARTHAHQRPPARPHACTQSGDVVELPLSVGFCGCHSTEVLKDIWLSLRSATRGQSALFSTWSRLRCMSEQGLQRVTKHQRAVFVSTCFDYVLSGFNLCPSGMRMFRSVIRVHILWMNKSPLSVYLLVHGNLQ